MDNYELWEKLKTRGFDIGDPSIRDDGKLLMRINNVFMFRPDAVDLANGNATLEDVISRNDGQVFPNAPR
jgi:hypothetical protein